MRHWSGPTPPDYTAVYAWRQKRLLDMRASPKDPETGVRRLVTGALEYYRTRPAEFISHWCDTFDPRNAADPDALTTMPMVLFPRQIELVEFLHQLVLGKANGLIEKSRDMGATWVAVGFSVWLWRFMPGAAVGWGSRSEDLVDKLGDPKSIFEKIRQCIRGLPREFWPRGFTESHMTSMRVLNPENEASIVGEIGDNIGRGGRTLVYFKDESAHYQRPEMIEAALGNNTNVQVDISSVNGLGNVFHRKRKAGVEWKPGQTMVRNRVNVFVMDWRENPLHTQEWYDNQFQDKESSGLLHVFEQEVNRNYAAAVEGVIIPRKWVLAARNAHKKIPGMDNGAWIAAIDPADEGGDKHAAGARKGVILKRAAHWAEGDTGTCTRKCVGMFRDLPSGPRKPLMIEYDSVGVGAGVKSESNRLAGLPAGDPEKLPDGMMFVPWNAGAAVLNPDDNVEPGDPNTPINKDYYANLKAQGWWLLRRRFEKTYLVIFEDQSYPVDELISIDVDAIGDDTASRLEDELSQPVRKKNLVSTKLTIDKKPAGTKSPNLADMVVMLYHPMPKIGYDAGDLAAAL